MIDKRTKLTILHDDNSVFTDYTNQSADYLRDEYTATLSSTEDYFYIGYSKPFNAAYIELTTANTNANTFAAEYWDGTAWTSIDLEDETNGWTRSGYFHWEKSDMNSTTINSLDRYYIRVRPNADHSATTIRGINLVFSDDNQMKQEFFEIDNSSLIPPGESSHIGSHVAARNIIVENFRRLGYLKTDASGSEILNQWDLHDIFEVRQAATYLALSRIFFTLSDSVDDNWWQKYREYNDKYEESMRIAKSSIDLDNDGLVDVDEDVKNQRSYRWNR